MAWSVVIQSGIYFAVVLYMFLLPVLSSFMTQKIIGLVTRTTRWVPHLEPKLRTLPEHLNPLDFQWGSCYSIFSSLCRSLFVFVFLLAIVLSVLRFTDSDYPFGNIKNLGMNSGSRECSCFLYDTHHLAHLIKSCWTPLRVNIFK